LGAAVRCAGRGPSLPVLCRENIASRAAAACRVILAEAMSRASTCKRSGGMIQLGIVDLRLNTDLEPSNLEKY